MSEQLYTLRSNLDVAVLHHFKIGKNEKGARGPTYTEWADMFPTTHSYETGIRPLPNLLADYAIDRWQQADPGQRAPHPTLILASPQASPHCNIIANGLHDRIKRRQDGSWASSSVRPIDPALHVVRMRSSYFDPIPGGWAKMPRHALTPQQIAAVTRFVHKRAAWENEDGTRPTAGMPNVPGSTVSPEEHFRAVYAGLRQLAAGRIGTLAVLVASSSTCYAAAEILSRPQALLSDIPRYAPYPARRIPYGQAFPFRVVDGESRPLTHTAVPIVEFLSDTVMRHMPGIHYNDLPPTEPFAI